MLLIMLLQLSQEFFKNIGWSKRRFTVTSTNRQLQNSHGDVKYEVENTVKNVVITTNDAKWVLEAMGEHFIK